MPADVSDLYRRVTAITTKYTFSAPVEASDLETVKAELAAAVPDGVVSVELGVDVAVIVDGRRVYHRLMLVKDVR